MDEVDFMRPRQPRAKNTFQKELDNKMRERRAKGLAAEVTSEESGDDGGDMHLDTLRPHNRPTSAKRRGEHASGSSFAPRGLGLGDTMRTQDMQRLLGRKTPTSFDEDDDEITGHLKTAPLAGGAGLAQRKTPTPTQGLFGRKTPVSPQELSKEDIIFGRKTPTGKSPRGAQDLPNLGGQQPWRPPTFQSVSPTPEHKAAAGGRRTPGLELESISESQQRTPRLEKRGSPGLLDESPRSDKPTPRARGRIGLAEKEKEKAPARTTPTLDLFGKSRRESSIEVEKELKDIEDKKALDERMQQRRLGRKPSSEDRKSPGFGRQGSGDRKSPIDARGRKTPTGLGAGRKSPGEGMFSKKKDLSESPPPLKKKEDSSTSLLAFLTGESDVKPKIPKGRSTDDDDDILKPKPKGRPTRRPKSPKDDHREALDLGEVPDIPKPIPRRRSGSQSSYCEDMKEDPTVYARGDAGDKKKNAKKTTENQKNEDAIDKVFEEQGRVDFKPLKKVRPVSADPKVLTRPKPRYGTLPGEKSREVKTPDYNSTMDIREAVYEDWYRKRMKSAREAEKEKKRKQEEEEKKKKADTEGKEKDAQEAFLAWEKNKKAEDAKRKVKEAEAEEEKKKKEQEERDDKLFASKGAFESWKKKKDESEKEEKEKRDKEKREKEKEEAEKKRKERRAARKNKPEEKPLDYNTWKETKDKIIHQKQKEKKSEKMKETVELATQRKKEEEAQHKYEEWMKNKEKQDHRKKIDARRRTLSDENDFRPPWSPANKLVPFGR